MSKDKTPEKSNEKNIVLDELSTVRLKLRGLGYLIEHHNQWESLDLDEVYSGIGAILNSISQDVEQVIEQLEKK